MKTEFTYKGRQVEILGKIYGGWGLCIRSLNNCEYRERSFAHREQAIFRAKELIDLDSSKKIKQSINN